jgi:hypothetical protein
MRASARARAISTEACCPGCAALAVELRELRARVEALVAEVRVMREAHIEVRERLQLLEARDRGVLEDAEQRVLEALALCVGLEEFSAAAVWRARGGADQDADMARLVEALRAARVRKVRKLSALLGRAEGHRLASGLALFRLHHGRGGRIWSFGDARRHIVTRPNDGAHDSHQ